MDSCIIGRVYDWASLKSTAGRDIDMIGRVQYLHLGETHIRPGTDIVKINATISRAGRKPKFAQLCAQIIF